MSEWRKLWAYYVKLEDGRTLIQMATSREDARANALVTMGLHQKIAVVRRATKDDNVASWDSKNGISRGIATRSSRDTTIHTGSARPARTTRCSRDRHTTAI